jgi:hypothetical protein
MSAEKEQRDIGELKDKLTGDKILSGALYVITVLLILGFLWQSIVSFFQLG